MKNELKALFDQLSGVIQNSYEEGVTLEQAERLAARFLHAQIQVAEALQKADLDARMRKSGIKAVKSAVYLEAATKGDKKPSDTFLQSIVDSSELVHGEQGRLDEAEVQKDLLQNYLSVFREGHIFYRGVSKGRFE